MTEDLPRTVVWLRQMDNATMERLTLSRPAGFHRFEGLVVGAEKGVPLRVDYRIDCDAEWRTQSCTVRQVLGNDERKLVLHIEGDRWHLNGAHAPALNGCSDVDLGISPSTNSLAINRLKLALGERRDIRAAWVRFPGLDVTPAVQSYERIGETCYVYRSLTSSFEAKLDFDEVGLVTLYENIWKCIATSPGGGQ